MLLQILVPGSGLYQPYCFKGDAAQKKIKNDDMISLRTSLIWWPAAQDIGTCYILLLKFVAHLISAINYAIIVSFK